MAQSLKITFSYKTMASIHELVASAEANPNDWDARLNLAQAYKDLGMIKEALIALQGNPLTPMSMGQSRMVKDLRSELDPDGTVDLSEPVHPVTGVLMKEDAAEEESEVLQAVEIVEDGSDSAPVEPMEWNDQDGEIHGERAIVLGGDVDMDTVKPQNKESDATQKASALTVAILVHVVIALLLGFVVMSMPPPNPPQIVATSFNEEVEDQIEEVKIQKKAQATASSRAVWNGRSSSPARVNTVKYLCSCTRTVRSGTKCSRKSGCR